MKLVSINVGVPRQVFWKDRFVTTAIFKAPVDGRVMARALNLDGDRQADLSVHGGVDKAVYAYPVEHYDYWRHEFPVMDLPFGMFGESFTIEGILENAANIGDRLRIGEAEFMVTQPRLPCYKLGIKFGRDDMVKRFLDSSRTGFYLQVLREGEVEAGDEMVRIGRNDKNVTVPDITRLYVTKNHNDTERELMRRAARLQPLPENWRSYFLQQLEKEETSA